MGNLKPKSYEESAESEIDEDSNKVGLQNFRHFY